MHGHCSICLRLAGGPSKEIRQRIGMPLIGAVKLGWANACCVISIPISLIEAYVFRIYDFFMLI
jgi:hypothetical protein